jgi:hypothetical protein
MINQSKLNNLQSHILKALEMKEEFPDDKKLHEIEDKLIDKWLTEIHNMFKT